MPNESTSPQPGPTSIAISTALAIAPAILTALRPGLGDLFAIGVKEYLAWLEVRGLPPDSEITPEMIAAFRADIAANSAAVQHARARAQVAAEGGTPTEG